MASHNEYEFFQRFVDEPYDKLLFLARQEFAEVAPALSNLFDGNEDATTIMRLIVYACLGTDGRLTELECKFLNDVLGSDDSYEKTEEMVVHLGDDAGDLTDRIVHHLPANKKTSLILFCLCFLAVDETISRDELSFLFKLMGA